MSEQPIPTKRTSAGILISARNWKLLVDLEQQLKFPNNMAAITLRPDIVLVAETTKQVVLLEPTVPWEDHLGEAIEGKLSKYARLAGNCQKVRLESQVPPSGGWMNDIRSPFFGQSFQQFGHQGREEKECHPQ